MVHEEILESRIARFRAGLLEDIFGINAEKKLNDFHKVQEAQEW